MPETLVVPVLVEGSPLLGWIFIQQQLEIWPQRPRYLAATIAVHYAVEGVAHQWGRHVSGGVALSMGGGTLVEVWHFPWG